MSDFIKTVAVLGGILLVSCLIVEVVRLVLEAIKLRRININRDLENDNKRLRNENAEIRAKHANALYAIQVHAATISNLVKENEALEAENRALMSGTPVSTIRGMRFTCVEK